MNLDRDYTFGSDPELFLVNAKTGRVVSAIDKIPGHKEEPFTEGLPEGFGLQTDNILAEFNIPPVKDEISFIESIEFMKNLIRDKAKEIDPNLDILCVASAKATPKELRHPQAKEFGCDPDFCVYTNAKNEVSKAARTNLRSAGFHIHVGYPDNSIDTSLAMLRYIDAFVGLPSILYDTDTERRSLYGKAGCFRLQKYGFEYRTLSSFWIGNPTRLRFIWRQVIYALHAFECNWNLPNGSDVRNAINNNDIEKAKELIVAYEIMHPKNVKPE